MQNKINIISENRSGENLQEILEVEILPILNEVIEEIETTEDASSLPTSEEPSSCPEENDPRASDQSHDQLPTNKQGQTFFAILKDLLRSSLERGKKGVRRQGRYRLELMYMEERCELMILNPDGARQWRGVKNTKDIYLKWRGDHMEALNLVNIQQVQKELEFLGILNVGMEACFSLAQTKFMEEPACVQKNMKLKITCGGVEIVFAEGVSKNVATIWWDGNSRPGYSIEVKNWWVKLRRFFHSLSFGDFVMFLSQLLPCLRFLACFPS